MVQLIKQIEGPAPGPGGVESLDSLAREGAALHAAENVESAKINQERGEAQAGQQRAQADHQQAQTAEAVKEVAGLLGAARDMAADLMQETGVLPAEKTLAIWTDQKLHAIAAPLMAVMERHGARIGPYLESYGPFVALGVALAVPTVGTIKAVRAHKAIPVESRIVPDPPGPADKPKKG